MMRSSMLWQGPPIVKGHHHHLFSSSSSTFPKCRCQVGSSSQQDWVRENEASVRGFPIALGAASMAALVLNRAASGIPLVTTASSSVSRADVLSLGLAASVLLTGLVWKSVQPKPAVPVELEGVECMRLAAERVADEVVQELKWTWEALQRATACRALVVVCQGTCLLQAGVAAQQKGEAVTVDAARLMHGSLCGAATRSGKQNYLANLALYPGRVELDFLPANTQAVILQPIEGGVVIAGSDVVRGFDLKDQAWIGAVGEKLQSTLADWQA